MRRHIFDSRIRRFGFLVSVLIISFFPVAQAKRNDLVIMKNGDRLTGEVKKLESGVLYIDLDYVSGSIGVDWLKVEKVESTGGFQVALKDGERIGGTIKKSPESEAPGKDFEVNGQSGILHAAAPDVVNIESQKRSFWRQLTGAIDLGYNFTSGNSQTSLSADANANYLSPKWFAGVSGNSSFSGQSGGSTSNLLQVQTLSGRFLSGNSFLVGMGDFLHSSQQDLALRASLGGGYGRFLIRTNHDILSWLAGVVYTREDFISAGQPAGHNAEGLLGLQYQMFRFDRYNLQSQLMVFPGLTDIGRVRLTTKTTFAIKLVNNFHTDFSFFDNFDSRPPSDAKRNELGVSNSLGWTF